MLYAGILPLPAGARDNVGTFTILEVTSLVNQELSGYLRAANGTNLGLTISPEGENYTLQFTREGGTDLLGHFILSGSTFTLNVEYTPYSYVELISNYESSTTSWEKVLRALEYCPTDLVIYGADPYANYCYNIISKSLGLPVSPTTANPVYEFTLLLNNNIWLAKDYIDIYTGANTNGRLSATVRGKVTRKQLMTVRKEELTLAGQPIVSEGLDKNGKYITINVPNSPINEPTGNIYRNGGEKYVDIYRSDGNKTAKWYIEESPIGVNGDAYTANQVYNDGISTLYSLISNTTLVDWTYIEWSLSETSNHEIRVSSSQQGCFSNIKIYKNDESDPFIDTTPNGDYDELFSVDAYGLATYKVVVTPRVGYKFDSDYTNTLYITMGIDTPVLNVEMSNQLDLVWDEIDSTTYYEIYQDGKLIDSVPSENNTLMARNIENKEKKEVD